MLQHTESCAPAGPGLGSRRTARRGRIDGGELTPSSSRATRKAGRTVASKARYTASLTASVCLALTLLVQIAPQLDPTLGSRRFHVGLETAAGMVLVFVAAVLLGRFRLNGSRRTLLKFGAVFVLAVDNLFSAALTMLVNLEETIRFTWTFTADGVLGAGLLALAAVLPDEPVRQRARGVIVVVAGSLGLLLTVIGTTILLGDTLPGAFETPPVTDEALQLLSEHPSLIVAEALTALFFGVAAIGFARLAEEEADEFLGWLSISAVIAAVAFVNYALFPSQLTELLYSGDMFFLAATAVLVIGAVREIANEEAARIRTAVLEERRRVARDLHDGVAQELAFIATQTRWFLRQPDDPQPLGQIMDAVAQRDRGAQPADRRAARPRARARRARHRQPRRRAPPARPRRGRRRAAGLARRAAADRARGGRERRPPRPRPHGRPAPARRRGRLAADHRRRRGLRPRRAALEPELRAHEHARARGVARRPLQHLVRARRRDDDRGRAAMSGSSGTPIEVVLS